jgi:HSP20 family molecular chaperone IbpA
MLKAHVVPVRVEKHLDALLPEAHGMPVNLYQTDRYLVINAGLPRCLAERVHVSVAPARMQIKAERHAGEESSCEERTYILSELPDGVLGRMLDLPAGKWSHGSGMGRTNASMS